MPPTIQQWLDQLKVFYGKMSNRARVVAGLCLGGVIALLAYMVLVDHTTYTVLFSGVSTEDAARIREQLIKDRVPYKLEQGSSSIMVPADRVHETRLLLAAKKLPRGGSVGFEILDKDKMGYSEFTNQVNYWRGLQGELERNFAWLDAVAAARVIIAMPHRSIFARRQQPSSASVTLRLHSGRTLSRSTVKGIVHLVSSSVAGLNPGRVTVVDTEGSVLWKPKNQAGDPANLQDFQVSQEASLERKLAEHLNATVGTGNWTGSVTVEVEQAAVEQMETEYNPDKTVVLSEGKQESKELRTSAQAKGIPGARGNLPGGPAPTAGKGQGGSSQKNKTVNYAPSVTQRKKMLPAGRLKRLSVVVTVDRTSLLGSTAIKGQGAAAEKPEGKARSKADQEKAKNELATAAAVAAAKLELLRKDIEVVVRNTVGYSLARGDRVVVKAVPFATKKAAPAAVPAFSVVSFVKTPTGMIAAGAAAAVLLVLVVLVLVRRKRKAASEVVQLPMTVRELESDLEHPPGERPALTEGDHQARDLAQAAAQSDVFRSAAVLRAWMARG